MIRRYLARRKMRWAVRMLAPSRGEPLYRYKLKKAIQAHRYAEHAMYELNQHPSLSGHAQD